VPGPSQVFTPCSVVSSVCTLYRVGTYPVAFDSNAGLQGMQGSETELFRERGHDQEYLSTLRQEVAVHGDAGRQSDSAVYIFQAEEMQTSPADPISDC
jgi:hypothetical protein